MAGKFWAAALVSAFISLSGAAAEPRRCFWCGPLAEQVHRSRRSAPCGSSEHVTVCEPGYNYCAVVATSPPRVESRYCVKMYQDECYPLFCNTTKTWKMTCPCRGDLCNGPNTVRETDAFALLPKLVAKTHNGRIKKRNANALPHLIRHDGKTKSNITSEKFIVNLDDDNSSDPSDNMQSDQSINIVVEHHVATENDAFNATNETRRKSTTYLNLIEIEIHVSDPTEGPVNGKENVQPCTVSPSTPKYDHEVTKPEEWLIVPSTETKQDNNTSAITENKDSTTTEPVQQNDAEVNSTNAPFDLTTKRDAETMTNNDLEKSGDSASTTETTITSTLKIEEVKEPEIPAEPVNQMQTNVPLTNSVNSGQPVSTTESTMITQTTLKIEELTEPKIPAEPVNQMQTNVPLTNSVNSGQSVSTTESTMITKTTLKIEEVKEPEIPAKPVNQMQNNVPLTNSVNSSQTVSSTESTMTTPTTFKIEVEDLGTNKGSEDQMQNDAPIDSAQPESTTATTLVQVTTSNDEVKPSKEMPTAEALQHNGTPAKATEKTLQAADEATTVNTFVASTDNIVAKSTPRSRRKNNTSRIHLNCALLISCFVYLLM